MISKLAKLLCVFSLSINLLSFGAEQEHNPYSVSWTTPGELETKGISCDFHKTIASRVAAAKASFGLKEQDNISAMAISAYGGLAQNRKGIFCDSGYLISSTLNVSIEVPLREPDGKVMLAIPDMFVGDRMRPGSMYRQNLVKRFLSFLISEEYTCDWGLLNELSVTRRVLASNRDDLKLKISTEQSEVEGLAHSPNLGKILHCEQTMFFKMLTDTEILNQLVDGLITKIQTSGIAGFFENNPQITLDMVTYNDMCPKVLCYVLQHATKASIVY